MEAIDIVKSIHTLFMEMKTLGFFCSSNWLRLVISFKFLTGNKRWRVMIVGDATFKWYRRSSSLGPESISTDWMAVSKVRCASRVELILEPLGVRWLSRRFLANFTIAMQMPPARAHTELAVKLSHRSGWQWLEVSGKKNNPTLSRLRCGALHRGGNQSTLRTGDWSCFAYFTLGPTELDSVAMSHTHRHRVIHGYPR